MPYQIIKNILNPFENMTFEIDYSSVISFQKHNCERNLFHFYSNHYIHSHFKCFNENISVLLKTKDKEQRQQLRLIDQPENHYMRTDIPEKPNHNPEKQAGKLIRVMQKKCLYRLLYPWG